VTGGCLLPRHLAHQQGLPWSEFWEFLNCSCDLSKEPGRRALEDYLQGVWGNSRTARPQSQINLRGSPELRDRAGTEENGGDNQEEGGGDNQEAGEETGVGGAEEEKASSMGEDLSALMEQKLSLQDSFEFNTPQIRRGQPIASGCFLTGWVSVGYIHTCIHVVMKFYSLPTGFAKLGDVSVVCHPQV